MLHRFRLEEPETIREASELLARFADSAKLYAGGTELLLTMKAGLVRYERLINVKKVRGLDEIHAVNGTIRIGALATHHELEKSAMLEQHLPALAKLEANVANVRVRRMGTIGGNLCFAEPHADPGTLLIALGARFVAEKFDSKREIPAESFFVDAYETCLEADEVLTEILVPRLPQRSGASYMKFGHLERPSVGTAVALSLNADDSIRDIRIAVGSAGPVPRRVPEAEERLRGKSLEEATGNMVEAAKTAAKAADAMSDVHGSKEYKEHIVGVLLKRSFQSALSQCR
jgi:carbon-monoxide dehydrogenase medium subunit